MHEYLAFLVCWLLHVVYFRADGQADVDGDTRFIPPKLDTLKSNPKLDNLESNVTPKIDNNELNITPKIDNLVSSPRHIDTQVSNPVNTARSCESAARPVNRSKDLDMGRVKSLKSSIYWKELAQPKSRQAIKVSWS